MCTLNYIHRNNHERMTICKAELKKSYFSILIPPGRNKEKTYVLSPSHSPAETSHASRQRHCTGADVFVPPEIHTYTEFKPLAQKYENQNTDQTDIFQIPTHYRTQNNICTNTIWALDVSSRYRLKGVGGGGGTKPQNFFVFWWRFGRNRLCFGYQ